MRQPAASSDPSPMRSFEAERRRHLIEATIETVAEVGFKAASLGEIARRADVSPGLFAHYFGDKDGLLEATLRFMATRLARATAERMRAAKTPLERVLAVPESMLAPSEFEPRASAVWLAFWGQIMHSPAYRRVQWIYQNRMRANLRHGLRELVAPERVEMCANIIAATIDGLWLQSHSDPDRGSDGARVRASVRDLVVLLIGADAAATSGRPRPPAAPSSGAPRPASIALDPVWRETDAARRAEVLARAAAALKAEKRRIALVEARESGRPVADVEAYDLAIASRLFERAAEALSTPRADRLAWGAGEFAWLDRRARDVVEARCHWSAPLLLASRIAAPALAAGATVVLRPAGGRARSLARMQALLVEAGLPEGALRLQAEPEASAAPNGWDDGAPKAAVVVAPGADPRAVAGALVRGPRPWARARALSETIVFAAEPVRAELVEGLRAEVAALAVGDPADPATDVGPLASRTELETASKLIAEARGAGAALRCGGRAVESEGRSRAVWLKPALLDRCRPDMRLVRAKAFAPIVPVCPYEDEAALADMLAVLGPDLSLAWFGPDLGRARALADAAGAAVCRLDGAGAGLACLAEDWTWTGRAEGARRIFVRDGRDPS